MSMINKDGLISGTGSVYVDQNNLPCGMPEGMCSCCDDLGCCHNPWWDDHEPYWTHSENTNEGGDK